MKLEKLVFGHRLPAHGPTPIPHGHTKEENLVLGPDELPPEHRGIIGAPPRPGGPLARCPMHPDSRLYPYPGSTPDSLPHQQREAQVMSLLNWFLRQPSSGKTEPAAGHPNLPREDHHATTWRSPHAMNRGITVGLTVGHDLPRAAGFHQTRRGRKEALLMQPRLTNKIPFKRDYHHGTSCRPSFWRCRGRHCA